MLESRKEKISKRAYAIWEAEGHPHGRDRDHWHRAEAELDAVGTGPAAKTAAGKQAEIKAAAPSVAAKVVSTIGRKKRR